MEIEKVSNFNFLGVILDEWLTWKPENIDKLVIKLSRNVGILNKLKNLLPLKTLIQSQSFAFKLWNTNMGIQMQPFGKITKASNSHSNACEI